MSQESQKGKANWMSLPSSSDELLKLYLMGKLHPAMKMADKALKINRSPKQAFILLVGLSGSGKSSTINYLFDKHIAPTSESESKTRCTKEYAVTMKSDEWKIPDLKLSVIDTPGFNDTAGLKQDARNVLSIKRFLEEHPYLNSYLPNLVMIVLNSQDNRYEGKNSHFAKMLKGLRHINAIDNDNPNVVVVLTHAASIAINPDKWHEITERKKHKVKTVVEFNLGISPSIVFQENLPNDFYLKQSGDWYLLPNDDKQPQTLFIACKDILKRSKDDLGLEAISVCFRPGEKKVEQGFVVKSLDIDPKRTNEMYLILLESVILVPDSEIGKMLEEYKKSQENTVYLQDDIIILQARLRDLGIKTRREIRSIKMNTLVSRMHPIRINRNMERILKDVFEIEYEQLTGFDCHIGKGYNIFRDTKVIMQPLQLSGCEGKYGLPDNVILKECSNYDIKCQAIKSSKEYIAERMRDLNLNIEGELNTDFFTIGTFKEGYNTVSSSRVQNVNTSSFLVEHKIYKVEVQQPYQLNPDLIHHLKQLPKEFKKEDEQNVSMWKAFFEKWGFHVITGIYIGGSLSGQVTTLGASSNEEACQRAEAGLSMKLAFLQRKGEFQLRQIKSSKAFEETLIQTKSSSIQWKGGDKSLYKTSLENISPSDWNRWIKSLEHSPAALLTSLDVCPLYQLVEEIDHDKATTMYRILKTAIEGKFRYSPKVPDDRQHTAESKKSGSCFHPLSTVTLTNGKTKLMKDVKEGDRIWTVDKTGKVTEDVVVAWLHRKIQGCFKFLKITHTRGSLCLTPEHIVFLGDKLSAHLASSIVPGQTFNCFLNSSTENPSCDLVTVLSVSEVKGTGIYAPLTRKGRLLVNGIAASCYCSINPITVLGREIVSSHSLAHFGFFPFRMKQSFGINKNKQNKLNEETGILPYAGWLSDRFLKYLK